MTAKTVDSELCWLITLVAQEIEFEKYGRFEKPMATEYRVPNLQKHLADAKLALKELVLGCVPEFKYPQGNGSPEAISNGGFNNCRREVIKKIEELFQ